MTTEATDAEYHDEARVIAARNVAFDWTQVPLHYLPGEPVATQFFNIMHLALPAGERAMAAALSDALPDIEDPRLREAVLGFIGQESVHAASHEGAALRLLEAHGVPVAPVLDRMQFLADRLLGDHGLTGRARKEWLHERLGIFAAMEHVTSVVGQSFLTNRHLDAMDPMMLDLLRWHGAEEVEHRAVVFDAYQYLDGSYARRLRTALLASVTLAGVHFALLRYLVRNDPSPQRSRHPALSYLRATTRGVIPGIGMLIREMPKYLRPDFHPDLMGGMDDAVRYLAVSPAARAAR